MVTKKKKKKKEVGDLDPALRALETAARPTLERIEGDRSTASPLIRSILAYLSGHLFDPDLDVNQLRRACGIRDNSLPIYFREAVGLPPFAYIESCRLEVASRLLASTRLKIWQIAQVLGYSTLQVFSRAFTRWSGGQNPSSFRRQVRKAQATGVPVDVPRAQPAAPAEAAPRSEQTLLETVQGLSQSETDDLARLLAKLYPKTFGPTVALDRSSLPPETTVLDQEGLERFYAEEKVWKSVRALPFEEAREHVRGYVFSSTALFDLLAEKAREEGRRDRNRGIELARLALESVEASAPALGDQIHEQRALGHIWIGNQRRLALDFLGAEGDFEQAQEALSQAPAGEESFTAGLVYAYKGSLRTFQRRFESALELINLSLEIFRKAGDRRQVAEQLLERASVAGYMGNSEGAVADLTTALGLANESNAEELAVMIRINLAYTLIEAHQFERADAALATVDRSLTESLDPSLSHHITCIEGAVDHGRQKFESAEEKYLAARLGFEEANQWLSSALVSLQIALLYSEMGRLSEMIQTCSEIIPFFESLELCKQTAVTLSLLREAVARGAISSSLLQEIRSAVLTDPLVALAS